MDPDELQLWNEYERTRADSARNAIAIRYLHLVEKTAHAMNRRNNRAEPTATTKPKGKLSKTWINQS
jgi:DNA-directed RNA polymerase specialized sigma subunit